MSIRNSVIVCEAMVWMQGMKRVPRMQQDLCQTKPTSKRRWRGLFVLLFCSLFLFGCFDYEEVEDVTLVSGLGVMMEAGEMVVHLELIEKGRVPSQGEGIKTIITKGKNFGDAMRNIVLQNGKAPYFGHTQVLVIDESAMGELSHIVYDLLAQKNLRYDMQIVVAKDAIDALFQSDEALRAFDLYELLKVNEAASTSVSMRILEYLKRRNVSYLLPVITMMEDQPTLTKGARYYTKDQLEGVAVDGEFVSAYLMLDGRFEYAWYLIDKPSEEQNFEQIMGELVGVKLDYDLKNRTIRIHGTLLVTEDDTSGVVKSNIEQMVKQNVVMFLKENQEKKLIDLVDKFTQTTWFISSEPLISQVFVEVEIDVMNSSNVRSDGDA